MNNSSFVSTLTGQNTTSTLPENFSKMPLHDKTKNNVFQAFSKKQDEVMFHAIAAIPLGPVGIAAPKGHQRSSFLASDVTGIPESPVLHPSVAPDYLRGNKKALPILSTLDQQSWPSIFSQNIAPPALSTTFPPPGARFENTAQLAYCGYLLQKCLDPSSAATSTPGEPLNPNQHALFESYAQSEDKTSCIRSLIQRVVEEFAADNLKTTAVLSEVILLAPSLDQEHYRKLLNCVIAELETAILLDVAVLQGLVQLVESASSDFLESDDLVRILAILRTSLQDTHQQSTKDPYYLAWALSRLLDVMVEGKVKNLRRVVDQEPLSALFIQLKDSKDPFLKHQATYAFQGLVHVPNDETRRQFMLKYAGNITMGLLGVASVCKLDLGQLKDGADHLYEAAGKAHEIGTKIVDGALTLFESGQGIRASTKGGILSSGRQLWYTCLREAQQHIYNGRLQYFNNLVFEAPCRDNIDFQWGICRLLGEIAFDAMWETSVRRQAVDLLGELYKNDVEWGHDESVRTWMLNIIGQLGAVDDEAVKTTAYTLLQEVQQEQGTVFSLPYPLRNRLPLPTSSPTLTRLQNIPYIEYDLHNLRQLRLEEHRKGVYISLQAKPNLQATDDTLYPLMEKALEFLTGRCQVFLLLGDSGAGKSTFNLELEYTLWKNYKKSGPIPLYINLPIIDNPAQELIEKQLQYHNFSDDQIQQMKLHREFVLICDGYDESRLKINLHSKNQFNQPGQWKVKMVVSCRSQYLRQNYRSRFQPQPTDRHRHSTAELFQEAVVAAFSRAQIQQYVEEYVKELPAVDPLQDRPSWTAKEYMDKLVNIPNLMDLVSNPFLLTLALHALPSVITPKKDFSAIRITRVQLYDSFVKRWLKANRARLEQSSLSEAERSELYLLDEDNFLYHGIKFQRDLSSAIFIKNAGNPVVKYTLRDKGTWKATFFVAEGQPKLLRESSTVVRTGSFFRFLHRSLLEYFYSRTIYDPHDYDTDAIADDREPTCDTKTCLAQMDIVGEPSIVQFLAERVRQDPSFQQQLLEAILESKTDAGVAVAASNAITILIRAGVSFNGVDLRGIKVPGADLSGGQFDSAQFQGADLTGVNLSKSWLRQANMSDANMQDVRFGELPYLEMDERVYSCTYSSDGKMLGIAVDDGSIYIYDSSIWIMKYHLKEHTYAVKSIAFSSDSKRLVSGSHDKTVRLWDVTCGKELLVMEGHSGYVYSVTISPCGNQVASASHDGTVRLWNTQTRETLFVLKGHGDWVMSVKYSPNGSQLVSGSWDGTIRFWDPMTGEPGVILSPSFGEVNCVDYSPDGRWVAAGHDDGQLQLWDAVTLEPGPTFSGHTNSVTGVDFSPDGQWIASSSEDLTVRLWNVSTSAPVAVLTGHNRPVNCVAFSPNGRQIASTSDDERVRLWEAGISWLSLDPQDGGRAKKFAYSCDGRSILSSDEGGIFRQWDAATGISAPIPFEIPEQEAIRSRVYALDGSQLAFGYEDGSIRLWNCQTGAAGPVLEGYSRRIHMLVYSPCCCWIVSVDTNNAVRMWDLHDVELPHFLIDVDENLNGDVRSVTFSSIGGQLAIRTGWDTICLFDTQSREYMGRMRLKRAILSLVYSPYDQQIAIGSESRIYLWDLQSEEPSAILEGYEDLVLWVAYSPCGQWIVSGSGDKTVGIWHRRLSGGVESWSRVHSICAFSGYVLGVAWNPIVPMELVTGAVDGSVRVWRMSIDEGGKVVFKMGWGSNLGTLCTECTIFTNAVGLSPIYEKLLVQRGAICHSNEPTFPHDWACPFS